jgi:IS1 family transposase
LVCPKLGFGQDSAKQIERSSHRGLNGALHPELLVSRSAQNVFVIYEDVNDANIWVNVNSANGRRSGAWQRHINTPLVLAIRGQAKRPYLSNVPIVKDGNANSSYGNREIGRIDNVERYCGKTAIRLRYLGIAGVPIVSDDPRAKCHFLQINAVPHFLGGASHLSGLICDGQPGEDCDNNEPPVRGFYGPFDGCVPIWRAIVGCIGLCAGYIAIFKIESRRWALCLGLILSGGGSFIWLTGHTDCKDADGKYYCSLHNFVIVPQKSLDILQLLGYSNCSEANMANVLNTDKKIAVIGALTEGSSIRSIERMTGVHRDTIMRLGVRVGEGCARLMDSKMRDLPCTRLEMDEIWGFVGKKERNVRLDEPAPVGNVWTFCAIDADTKLVPAFKVGDRGIATARAFVQDIASRMRTRVQISTDGLRAYVEAIEGAFGSEVDYAQIVKTYGHEEVSDNRRYSAPEFVSSEKKVITGNPDERLISTSYVERLNATTRLHMRRLTRLTLAFSKKRENFEAAVALHFAYYNFVKRHNTLRCTPAMAVGIERDFWSVGNLIEAAA